MIGIAFYFEDTVVNMYSGRWDGDIQMWRTLVDAFEKVSLIMIDKTRDERGKYFRDHLSQKDLDFHRFRTLEEVEAAFPTQHFVYVESKETLQARGVESVALPISPVWGDAIYVFGSDSPSTDLITGRENKTWVSIPSAGVLWAICAATVVLYDRYIK